MREKGSLVRIFARIPKGEAEVFYHRGSWDGPLVFPVRFYPPRLVKLVEEKDEVDPFKDRWVPDASGLVQNSPRDERVNAYVLGDSSYFGTRSSSSIVQPSPGQGWRGGSSSSQQMADEKYNSQRLVCVSYCSISQGDLEKEFGIPRENNS